MSAGSPVLEVGLEPEEQQGYEVHHQRLVGDSSAGLMQVLLP